MDGRKTANHNMNSKCKNIVTAPGGSDLQESLVAGGSGVNIRSNGAGLLLSLPVNRDKSDKGVSSMAPDSDKHATAETDVPPGTQPRDMLYFKHHRAHDTGENVAVATNLTLTDHKRMRSSYEDDDQNRKMSRTSRAELDIHHVIGKYLIHVNDPRHNNKIYKYGRYQCQTILEPNQSDDCIDFTMVYAMLRIDKKNI
ncbi:uncharacterized protein LOC132947576 [Metopolophium dirhodum]|uniref:uncharacterized protein LOC132947576 n=1 Tax=Metopolophium dirhodum TaxID=44670 RepID=UPI00298F9F33|nr:uncharacterized protein LOC132947576 [Metopolophium dirhodum]